jgi:hypothetical protein
VFVIQAMKAQSTSPETSDTVLLRDAMLRCRLAGRAELLAHDWDPSTPNAVIARYAAAARADGCVDAAGVVTTLVAAPEPQESTAFDPYAVELTFIEDAAATETDWVS